jgi:GNAT superfamily N-acetyltransferase
MTTDFSIRRASVADAAAIAQVHVKSWQHAYRDLLPADYLAALSVAERQALWQSTLPRPHAPVWLAEVAGQVVGFISIGPCRDPVVPPNAYEIWAFYLLPEYWAQGIGRALWQAVQQALLPLHVPSISLWVICGNRRAIDFYEAAGFLPDEASQQPFELAGVTLHEMRYILELESAP